MSPLSSFFLLDDRPAGELLGIGHDPWLVGLSVVVAVVTSYIALSLSDRAREASTHRLRLGAIAAGTLSLGGGVWTMHFIGMLAFQLCTRVGYDPVWTLGSMLPSLGAAGAALLGLTHRRVRLQRLVVGGICMGSGIGLMHYGGMAAVRSSAQLRYDPGWFGASIVVAVALSVLALALHHGLRRQLGGHPRLRTLLAAATLGGAISGMHYTAMAAARFVGTADTTLPDALPLHLELALGVALTALVVSVVSVGLNAVLVQRQLARDRLRSELRLQALVDTAVDGVVRMDGHGVIVAANQATERIFGLGQEALVGQVLARLVPGLQLRGDGFTGVLESSARRADGQPMLLRVSVGRSLHDGELQRVAFVSDITDGRRRQAELEGVQAAIERALVVVEFDLDGRILRANAAFLALTGHSAATLVGQHHSVLCLPGEPARDAYRAHWEALRRGEFRTGDFERVRHGGQRIWIRATYNPILDADGRPQRIVKFVNDLTDRHMLELDLRQAKGRAEQAAAAKSTFLANMSHEIRTPMNAIIGFTEVALDGALSAETRGHLQVIHRSSRSLLGLLNDILDTAKLDHGAVELERHDFALRQLCGDVLATLQVAAMRKGLPLLLEVDDALPAHLHGDPMRLQQVLLNLVGNAVKFTEHGAVTLAVQCVDGGLLELAVHDTGIGIAPDRLGHIFDPFAQADATTTRRFGGTGLGTTIARQLVQLMGGEIGVRSTPGEGSTFWFRVPLVAGQAPAAAAAALAQVALPPLRILAADDVPENLQLLALRLGGMGHTVTPARDGQEALERLCAGGFDIALLDVQMPLLDGLQACRMLRAHEAAQGCARLPVLALTASASAEDRATTTEVGMDGFVVKPIDWPVLLGEMARVLGLAPAAAAAPPAATPGLVDGTGPALPEPVDWPQALARWGALASWQAQLQRFLDSTLQAWPADGHDGALAHRLRGAGANFGLADLAAACGQLEQAGPGAGPQAWQALHRRLQALQQALAAAAAARGHGAAGELAPATTLPWPAMAAATLADALQRGELPAEACRAVLDALPAVERAALQDAIDGFDFDAARALLARHTLEPA